nr:choice-of-anchor D domain-containing protein [Propionibacterium sp.]
MVRTGVSFGDVPVGSTSPTETVTVTNVSTAPVTVEMAGGAPAAPFDGSQNCMSQTLALGGTCSVSYTVTPTATGPVTATSGFTLNGEAFTVDLSANGINRFRINTTSIDFGDVGVGVTSPTVPVTLTNVGTAPVTVEMAGGAPAAPFDGSQNCAGVVLAPGGTCSVSYTVTPTATGPVTATSGFTLNGQSFTVHLTANGLPTDTTPPAIVPSITGTLGLAGWYTTATDVSWTVTDSESGISSSTGCGPTTVTDTTGQTLTCSATSDGGTSISSVTVKVDTAAPVVTLVGGPADGASYEYGSVPAQPTCTALDATSGVVGPCVVTGWSDALGIHTVTGTASDAAGNTGTATATYSVTHDGLLGFFSPIRMGEVNTVKGGSTVPVKFQLWDGAIEITDPEAVSSLTVTPAHCSNWDPIGAATELLGSLRYAETGGQFSLNWRVPKPAGRCYVITATAAEGDPLVARFKTR